MYAKLFERGGVAVRLRLYTKTEGGGGGGVAVSLRLYTKTEGGGGGLQSAYGYIPKLRGGGQSAS